MDAYILAGLAVMGFAAWLAASKVLDDEMRRNLRARQR
jgi:hypothetical protein